ncbi:MULTISPECIES: DUF302 domain-containing protein [Carboxydocella]|uniref:Uncharacterized conserved protein, DUF302 family n=2 Tax=Carboxydocella TaxID=178898 RepID=A0A1T4NRG3_9FIRM|nr:MULTISPECIES: DUF302 domain-containing protein [Carboxydocella]AVX20219.1 Uncharacterized conserved protein, DUF302 family [Carboxydocella thermautotrophica]GAW31052.1 hypothetical protein JDF658_08170 [Carboxydocella sp. JDF658]SJZ81772.1 Uncharacterized conserved protein, DUF302 family [Carboxydocella sporoproducens DSM 16521]
MIDLGISKKVSGEFSQVEEKVRTALQNNGFGVITEIDVKETLKKKLDVDYRNYKILGACNPPMAYKALSLEPAIGLMLPCNVIVAEEDDGILVSAINPMTMMGIMNNEGLLEVATQVTEKLQKVIAEV